MQGTVRKFDSERGWGFISGDDGSDIFLHINALKKAGIDLIEVGDRMDAEVESTPKGMRVRRINSFEALP